MNVSLLSRRVPAILPADGLVSTHDFLRRNLLNYSEGPLANIPTKGGTPAVTEAAGDGDFSAWFQYASNPTATQYAYPPAAVTATGVRHNASVFVRMDDGGVPKPGISTDSTADFTLVVGGNQVVSGYQVDALGGGLYRVSGSTIASAATINGAARYATQSKRGLKVTGFMLTLGAAVYPYEKQTAGQTAAGLTLGTDSGVDNGDPAWTTSGLLFGADDLLTGLSAPGNASTILTAYDDRIDVVSSTGLALVNGRAGAALSPDLGTAGGANGKNVKYRATWDRPLSRFEAVSATRYVRQLFLNQSRP